LAAGTLKLDGSDVAVDPLQASQLLPLWQALSSLLTSATSSDQEIQGVVAQIDATMSADQVAAIATMQITQSDLTELLRSTPPGLADGGTSAQIQATRRAGSEGGFGPGDGFGPGSGGSGAFIGSGPGGGSAGGLAGASAEFPQTTASADRQATAQAYKDQYAAAGVNPMVVRAVIQYLQSKSG